jgi:chemosensory pili system protein ChpA (sensor histidine kinase/response regulator)
MLLRWIERCSSWASSLWRRVAGALARAPREVLDPDIRDVFLAELDELSVALAGSLQGLRDKPDDQLALQTLRRAFHTIKGSGLMAGALSLAGVCGRLERLAVQLIERRITATPEVLAAIEEAIRLLPACRHSIEVGAPMPASMAAVGLHVKRLLGET